MGERLAPIVVFMLLVGLTSLLADFTYEGGRSVIGPYLEALGGAILIAGAISVGDLVGYAARLASGLVAGRYARGDPRILWGLTFTGYATNLAIPLLAFARDPLEAFLLVVVERAGKGLRAPARDSILKTSTGGIGKGWVYGLHELMDQAGAVLGPLALAYWLHAHGYSGAYLRLAPMVGLSLATLAAALLVWSRLLGSPSPRPSRPPSLRGPAGLLAGVSSYRLAMAHWGLAGYILASQGLPPERIAQLYALAMAVDGLAAIPLGGLYQALGARTLYMLPPLAAASTILFLQGEPVAAAILWGLATTVDEVAVKAAIADSAPSGEEPVWFGVYGGLQGLAWTLGNLALAALATPAAMVAYTIAAGALSIVWLGWSLEKMRG